MCEINRRTLNDLATKLGIRRPSHELTARERDSAWSLEEVLYAIIERLPREERYREGRDRDYR